MQLVYALEEVPSEYTKAIFLAGPTPRNSEVKGWREKALIYLGKLGYDGVVFVPLPRDQEWYNDYTGQIEWEQKCRRLADIILFWVPRRILHMRLGVVDLNMPAFTTNIEFGEDRSSYKMVYGRPDDAEKCNYLDFLYKQTYSCEPRTTLFETVKDAIGEIGEGVLRKGGERSIPLHIWKTDAFQKWYQSHLEVGNRLEDAKVLSQFIIPNIGFVFMFQLWVKVWIEQEKRYKENEFIISRPDISVIAAYHRDELDRSDIDAEVLLIKEFRSPVRNNTGFVYELAGGSSFKNTEDIMELAASELCEETGIVVSPDQMVFHGGRQLAATWSTHFAHLFSCELTEEQFEQARHAAANNQVFGNLEDSERTFIRIARVRDLLQTREVNPVDWSMLGMICKAILRT